MSTKPAVDDGEPDFELITSARMLGSGPPLRSEMVTIDAWKTASGKSARFALWELTAAEYSEFMEEGRNYKDGVLLGYDHAGEDFRFLAWTMRDQNNNRLRQKTADAKAILGTIGKASLNVLLNAANRCNAPVEASAKGNSPETPSDS
jgi:hypothetical protein